MEQTVAPYYWHNNAIKDSCSFAGSFIDQGLALYEVIRIIDGVPLFLEEHLLRLEASARQTGVSIEQPRPYIETVIGQLIEANHHLAGNIKLVLHYTGSSRDDYELMAYYIPHHYPSLEHYLHGVQVITYEAERTNPQAKVANAEWREKINEAIDAGGAYEALLVDREGYITEGSRSNVFVVLENQLHTAPVESVLPGITRTRLLALCKSLGIPVAERKVHVKELADAEALFLTGTSPRILPVTRVNHLEIASSIHPLVKTLIKAYDMEITEYVKKRKNDINDYRE